MKCEAEGNCWSRDEEMSCAVITAPCCVDPFLASATSQSSDCGHESHRRAENDEARTWFLLKMPAPKATAGLMNRKMKRIFRVPETPNLFTHHIKPNREGTVHRHCIDSSYPKSDFTEIH